jgi:hypothetical protein
MDYHLSLIRLFINTTIKCGNIKYFNYCVGVLMKNNCNPSYDRNLIFQTNDILFLHSVVKNKSITVDEIIVGLKSLPESNPHRDDLLLVIKDYYSSGLLNFTEDQLIN